MNTELLLNCRAELYAHIALANAAIASLDLILAQDQPPVPTSASPQLKSGKARRSLSHRMGEGRGEGHGRKSPRHEPGGLSAAMERVLPKLAEPFTSRDVRAAVREAAPDIDRAKLSNVPGWLNRAVRNKRLTIEKDGYRRILAEASATEGAQLSASSSDTKPPRLKRTKDEAPSEIPVAGDIEEAVRDTVAAMVRDEFRVWDLLAILERRYPALYRNAEAGAVRAELKIMSGEGMLAETTAADGKPMWRKTSVR